MLHMNADVMIQFIHNTSSNWKKPNKWHSSILLCTDLARVDLGIQSKHRSLSAGAIIFTPRNVGISCWKQLELLNSNNEDSLSPHSEILIVLCSLLSGVYRKLMMSKQAPC